jgi:hypothetical protein
MSQEALRSIPSLPKKKKKNHEHSNVTAHECSTGSCSCCPWAGLHLFHLTNSIPFSLLSATTWDRHVRYLTAGCEIVLETAFAKKALTPHLSLK